MTTNIQLYQEKALDLGCKIAETMDKVEQDSTLLNKLQNTRKLLDDAITRLSGNTWNISFMGRVGVGKTSAICHLLGLHTEDGAMLNTGSGRTTVCEVELQSAEDVSISIVPSAPETVHAYLDEFAQYLSSKRGEELSGTTAGLKPSSEVERALRNMLGLQIKRTRTTERRIQSIDLAEQLFDELGDKEQFIQKIKDIINLEDRCQTTFTPSGGDIENSALWLQRTFSALNNGRHSHATLPEKIIIRVNQTLFPSDAGTINVQDTKGIDDTANRADLLNKMNCRRTLNILCTGFNDAPDKATQSLLDVAMKSGQSDYLADETLLLVLDRSGDAENTTDIDEAVNDVDLGRAIRHEQVEQQLQQSLRLKGIDIEFYNALNDDIEPLQSVITDKLARLQARLFSEIDSLETSIQQLSLEAESHRVNPAIETVRTTLEPWLRKVIVNVDGIQDFFKDLANEIRHSHPGSVRASVNRRGQWYNLDFYHVLAQSSRSKLVAHFEPLKREIDCLLDNLLERTDQDSSATGFINQIKTTVEHQTQEIYTQGFNLSLEMIKEPLKEDWDHWRSLQKEWGKGPGYKDRIADASALWFQSPDYRDTEELVRIRAQGIWNQFIQEVAGMVDIDCEMAA
ncbi:hypothetical protein [Kistimonas asteriae]|uniref:hypothetical protein n=1 Tax=Kistimonas asteriae TaxID=517724 RepID=UPI001BAE0228|nr:hypothetical protein [Kistimonas asteriae]